MADGPWDVVETGRGDAHVLPPDDLVAHEFADDCPCGPNRIPVPRDDGTTGYVIQHRALDART